MFENDMHDAADSVWRTLSCARFDFFALSFVLCFIISSADKKRGTGSEEKMHPFGRTITRSVNNARRFSSSSSFLPLTLSRLT